MSKKCAICGKKPVMGNSISHAHNINKRRFMPNLQKIKIEAGGKAKKVYVCTKCIKSGRVKKVF